MKTTQQAPAGSRSADFRPADTRMMGIVHDALRRDLRRAVATLTAAPFPEDAQRAALSGHLAWLMRFLEAHHRGEDAGLWPLVRSREPSAALLLDEMEADHRRVAPLVAACAGAAGAYGDSAAAASRIELLCAVESLADALLPHLAAEESEMLPIVSVSVSDAEWKAIDNEHYIEHKGLAELGFEGHWLLDGLDPGRYQVVVHQVPAIPRFILVHGGFARRYRRYAERCWGPAGTDTSASPKPFGPAARPARKVGLSGGAETVVPAPLDAVWAVVSDVTRTGEWSRECRQVEWIDGATRAEPGARFKGTNKAGPWTWSRTNEVVAVDAPHSLVWRTIPQRSTPDSSEWRFRLEDRGGGTLVKQDFRVVGGPAVLARLYALAVPSHVDRGSELRGDLERLGAVAARDARSQRPAS